MSAGQQLYKKRAKGWLLYHGLIGGGTNYDGYTTQAGRVGPAWDARVRSHGQMFCIVWLFVWN
jgi:hypothetical protein